jgi:hypothetical protein
MKIAILNDTHCGIRNSSDVFIDNAEKFYSEVFFPYLLENNIKHILHLGDYYDNRKFINFKALNRNRKTFLSKLREHGITMDVTLGNHDVYYKNTNDLNSLKELLGHYMNEVHIISEPSVLEYNELKIGVVPWINPENEKESLQFIEKCDAPILAGHFEISGFEVSRGIEHHGGMSPSIFNRFETVLSGHFHVKSTKGNITYLGSQMEFYWSDAHDPKFFHVIDTKTREIEAINNPHTLFHRIRYDDSKYDYTDYDLDQVENKFVKIVVINKSDLFTFDRFVDRIQSKRIHELKIQENFSEFVGENVDDESISLEDTNSLVNSYIDNVETDLNKDRIKNEVYDLYIEAQTLEIT